MYPICNLRYFQVARVFEFYSLLFLKDCSTLHIPNCSLKMVSRYEGRMCFCPLLLSFPFSGLQSSALILFELSALLAFRAAVSTFSPDVDGANAMLSDRLSVTQALTGAAHHLTVRL